MYLSKRVPLISWQIFPTWFGKLNYSERCAAHGVKGIIFWTHWVWIICHRFAAAAAKSLQLCPTLCNPIDGSPPGSCVHGILQARVLEWVAIAFSNALKWKVKVKSLSRVRLLATPRTAPYQAPASMGFSRQEYWSGLPLPSPRNYWIPLMKNLNL